VSTGAFDGSRPDRFLALRALLAFLALPGLLAYALPLLVVQPPHVRALWQWAGLLLVGAGSCLLLLCVYEFYAEGRGTLAPWSPPRHLVESGPYRISRNPMYVAIVTVLLGWATWFGSPGLLAYALAVAVAFHVRVITYEEPTLARSFENDWRRYRERVRRWL